MREVSKAEWLAALREGDMGLTQGTSLLAKLQRAYARKREGIRDWSASHGFYQKAPPLISEADGKIVTGRNTIARYFSDHHRIWMFRHPHVLDVLPVMRGVVAGAEKGGAVYSWGGIWAFARRYLFRKPIKDRRGVFCTEYLSAIINQAGLPYTTKPEWEVTPTFQLDWFMDKGLQLGWYVAAHYDRGRFLLP